MREAIERAAANNALRQKKLDEFSAPSGRSGDPGDIVGALAGLFRQGDINRENERLAPQMQEFGRQDRVALAQQVGGGATADSFSLPQLQAIRADQLKEESKQRNTDSDGLTLFQQESMDMRREAADLKQQDVELRRQEAKDKKIDINTQALSNRIDKSGALDLVNAFKNLDALVPQDEDADIPGFGATGLLPNFATSRAGQDIRQEVQTLKNVILKARSGGAVTPQEAERLLKEIGDASGFTDRQLRRGLNNAKKIIQESTDNIFAGFDEDTVNTYTQRGGLSRSTFAKPIAAKPTAAPAANPTAAPDVGNKMLLGY